MSVRYDERADALYVRLAEAPIVESEEVAPGVALDYDERGEVVGHYAWVPTQGCFHCPSIPPGRRRPH